jgi:hypothetical protein
LRRRVLGWASSICVGAAVALSFASSSNSSPAQRVLLFSSNHYFALQGTRIRCEGSAHSSVLCSTSTSPDPLSGSYSVIVDGAGDLVLASVQLTGVRILYSSGRRQVPGRFAAGGAVSVHAGDVLLMSSGTVGCTVAATAIRCASHVTRQGAPLPRSRGFTVRADGSARMLAFGKAEKTLFAAKPAKMTSHNTYNLQVGDLFAVAGTRVGCAIAAPQTVGVTLVDCFISGSNGVLDGSYGTVSQADGRVVVGQYNGGAFSVLFTRAAERAFAPAALAAARNDVTVDVGDTVRIAGLSLGCRVGDFDAGSSGRRKFVGCGLSDASGFKPNSNLGLLEQDGIALAARLDKDRATHVLFVRP